MPSDPIISQLSLEEKVSLTSAADWWRTPVIKKNGKILIPHVKTTDGPNGARGESYVSGVKSACFPCSTCVGASFDLETAYRTGKEIALEAISKSANILLAPTVNLIRSPLGGRNHETFSEDPHLLGVMGAAYINGCQSVGVGATPKHFVANDIEKRRRFLTAEIDERTLREVYLLPFQIILKLSDPWCLMTSYNRVNGTYCANDPRLLDDILRKEWGFNGLLMSDWVGTYSTHKAIDAGLDLEMPGPTKLRGDKLVCAVQEGQVSETTIDASATRVLELVRKSGRFEDSEDKDEVYLEDSGRDEFIAQSAAESAVLLKNAYNVLPLRPASNIVVIGQHAMVPTVGGGGSAKVDCARLVAPVTGLQDAGVQFHYERGVPVFAAVPLPEPETLAITGNPASNGSTQKPVKLEWFNGSRVGENTVRVQMLEKTEYMIKERWPMYLDPDYCTRLTFDLTPKTSGKHLVSVLTTGTATLYINDKEAFHRPQEQQLQREAFYFFRSKFERTFNFSMEAGKRYTFRLESWATEPEALARTIGGAVIQGSGVRFFESVDVPTQIKSAAVAASKADVALVFTGTTNEIESEGYDRETMDLTGDQYSLIDAVAASNPNTVVVNYSGSPVSMHQFIDKVAGIVQCWFPGQECGNAVAKVLTGRVNPCGRLPMTWPKDLKDHATYGNWPGDDNDVIRYEEGTFVGYRHYDRTGIPPLFPFGFGLSYSTFKLSGTHIVGQFSGPDGKIQVATSVSNTGEKAGKVVIQFYVEPPVYGIDRPKKELKAFRKPLLASGTSGDVVVELDKYAVSFYDGTNARWKFFPGKYKVLVGFSSTEIVDEAVFKIVEGSTWQGL
ncbi:hypothetical protein BU16DRAFT_461709 [Lophium mytilinum]|uniref:beta-glucosidase n=1 Tax=Lophium mytilinum TaxID=390894 RepID=A0A6A6QS88_9PEZI|nr:hypothetical protein BU16DRAFT_461709 [Lophium mytilinum]